MSSPQVRLSWGVLNLGNSANGTFERSLFRKSNLRDNRQQNIIRENIILNSNV